MDIESILKKQRAYFAAGETLSLDFRKQALIRLKEAICTNEGQIFSALHEDLHKTGFEGYMTEVGMVREDLGYAIKNIGKWMRPQRARTPLAQFSAKSFMLSEPYGVALIMSPWNYPFQLSLEPLTGAIAAGNCAVLKPSAYAPATSRVIAKLLGEIFPPEYIAVVEGGRAANAELLEQKFDYIFFTGSVNVGKLVMEKASRYLTPVSLELGGKSPCIVDGTAKLKLAAKRLAFGKYLNAGQTCVAPDYLYVHESVREPFLQYFKEALESFYPNGDFSSMPLIVNQKHFERLCGLMRGENILLGGQTDAESRFIAPTVLGGVTWESPVMKEEIFGPILPVLTYTDKQEVIDAINAHPKPLALYLFTTDRETREAFLKHTSFGGGCINDTIIHLATSRMGFGGVGESGMGRYHGKFSFDTFTHYKSIVSKHNFIDLPMRYLPYTEKNLNWIRMLLK